MRKPMTTSMLIISALILSSYGLGIVDDNGYNTYYEIEVDLEAGSSRNNMMDTNDLYIGSSDNCFFIENRGQADEGCGRYYSMGDPLSVAFGDDWFAYFYNPPGSTNKASSALIKVRFMDASEVNLRPMDATQMTLSYMLGNDESKWLNGISSYRTLIYEDLWDDIDLRFLFSDGQMKYEFIVPPGNDPGNIQLMYEGVDDMMIDPIDKDLCLSNSLLTLKDRRPYAYHLDGGVRSRVPCEFDITQDPVVGFMLGIEEVTRTTIIDPGINFFSFIGGGQYDYGNGLAQDANGDLYLTGWTNSPNFPTTAGVYDRTLDQIDSYIACINGSDGTIRYISFIGGGLDDRATDVVVTGDGNAIILGNTYSKDFPITPGAMNLTSSSQSPDVFITMIDPRGSGPIYSCVIGGNKTDSGLALAVDPSGCTYLTGYTSSDDLPVSGSAFDQERSSGSTDAFVMKISAIGDSIVYCSYLGGTNEENLGEKVGIVVDNASCAYVCGQTSSDDFPTVPGSYDTSFNGVKDIFITKFNENGSALIFSTYLGGSRTDDSNAICLDGNGRVLVTGHTTSQDYPRSSNAFDVIYNGESEALLTILDPNGTTLEVSSYLGGSSAEVGYGITVDEFGNPYICGYTLSHDFPTTNDGFDNTFNGIRDAFVVKMDPNGTDVLASTFIGGSDEDRAREVLVTGSGYVSVIGETHSVDFPTTISAPYTRHSGQADTFVCSFRFDPIQGVAPGPPRNLTGIGGDRAYDIEWRPPSVDGGSPILNYTLYLGPSTSDLTPAQNVSSYPHEFSSTMAIAGRIYYAAVSASNTIGEGPLSNIINVTPFGQPTPPQNLSWESGSVSVNLSWDEPDDIGDLPVLGYWVYRGNTKMTLDRIVVVGPEKLFYVDEGLEIGREYYYKVCAYNARGNGTFTEIIDAIPTGPPGMPRDLEVIAEDGVVTLQWTPPASDGGRPILGYHIYRGATIESITEYESIAVFLSFQDDNVTNGKDYYYTIQPFNANGDGSRSPIVHARPVGKPGPPVVSKIFEGDRRISLNWTPPNDDGGSTIVGYNVYRGEDGTELKLFKRLGNTLSWTDTDVVNGIKYYYRVSAFNNVNEGVLSELVVAKPLGYPGSPRDVGISQEGSQFRLTWTSPMDWGGAESLNYIVMRGTSIDGLEFLVDVSFDQFYIDKDIGHLQRYYYRVLAYNDRGNGTRSESVSLMMVPKLEPPNNLTAYPRNNSILLMWDGLDEGSGTDVDGYLILRGLFSTGLLKVATINVTDTYLDIGLENGIEYFFAIKSFNSYGESPWSNIVNVTPMDIPGPPTQFSGRVQGQRVILTWSRPTEYGSPVLDYKILRWSSTNETVQIFFTDRTEFIDTDIDEGTVYYYRVVARSTVGDGESSREITVEVTTNDEPERLPLAPLLIVIAITVVAIVIFYLKNKKRSND